MLMIELPVPEPGEGEVRVKVEAAGICGSELEAFRKHSPRRTPPLVLGHEFTGVIDKIGSGVGDWKVGDSVVANAVIADGTCDACRRGDTHLCANRELFGMHRPGAFAEFVNVPARVLIQRPAGVSPSAAALTEPLANGVHVAGLLADQSPKTVVVFGAGPIGLLTAQVIRFNLGSRVAVVDIAGSRLDIAKRHGAELTITPESLGALKDWAGGAGPDASVDAVGAEATKLASVSVIRLGGTAVWIGLHENTSPFNAYDLILAEKRLLGSYACTQAELAEALDLIADGKIDVSWISTFPLDDGVAAFNRMVNPRPVDVKGVFGDGLKLARIRSAAGPVWASFVDGSYVGVEWRDGLPLSTGEAVSAGPLMAPVDPPLILAIGLNYRHHAQESGAEIPRFPVVFGKWPNSLIGPEDDIVLPRVLRSDKVDFECELAFVFSRDAKNVRRDDAMDYVLGFTAANDVSARDWQKEWGGSQWSRAKSFDTFCPCGPYLVTLDELPRFDNLRIATRVNGETMQDWNTVDLIFNVPALVEFLSGSTTLPAGTMVLTGTPHGVGMARKPPVWLQPGDLVEVEIEAIGTLRNRVLEEKG